ncbi:Scr1 family TA system antitoxin-like transcriptional regulator [Streptomyces sp. NBC_00445]|uniref:Scr1 family TA system antitoxin-like transcriptional regulator n=1 Tax=Streptomyces sp. NBC_00445 TaxID=2975745 RepID=UPI002E1A71A0
MIHEAAFRIQVAGRAASRAQLARILELSDADHVAVRVIPYGLDDFAGAGSAMVYVGGAVSCSDTVVGNAPHGTGFIDSEAELEHSRRLFRRVKETSLTPSSHASSSTRWPRNCEDSHDRPRSVEEVVLLRRR